MKHMLAIQGLTLLGLADALIIAKHHFVPGPAPAYAFTYGIPNAFAGATLLMVVLALSCVWVAWQRRVLLYVLQALLSLGVLAALGTFWLQTFVLRFFCPYAYGAVAIGCAMFLLGFGVSREQRV